MVKAVAFLPFYFFTFLPLSCVDVTEHEDTPEGNFEALWRVIDEHYCFFDYKQQVSTTNSSKSSPICSPN